MAAPSLHTTSAVAPEGSDALLVEDIVEVQSARSKAPPIQAVEVLVGEGQWAKVIELLEPAAVGLPPAHRLLYAMALREVGGDEARLRHADGLAISAIASLLDVDEQGPVARLVARRLHRRTLRQVPAPKARVQVVLVLAAIVLGAFVGWAWDEWNDRRSTRQVPASAVSADGVVPPAE